MSTTHDDTGRLSASSQATDSHDPGPYDLRQVGLAARGLTERQRQLLVLVAEGNSSKQIAAQTGMAVASIDNALSRAARILGARNRREAATLFAMLRRDGWEPHHGLELPALTEAGLYPPAGANDTGAGQEGRRNELSSAVRVIRALSGPPFGGPAVPDDWRSVTLQVLWVAFIGTIAVTGTTLLILAFYATFAGQ